MNSPLDKDSLRPSSAPRWMLCRGGPRLITETRREVISELKSQGVDVPAQYDPLAGQTVYAQEGIYAHQIADKWLKRHKTRLHESLPEYEQTMLRDYVNYWHKLADQTGGRLMSESKVKLWYAPDRKAVIDVAVVVPADTLYVGDLKWGAGHAVWPDSWQLRIYAIAALYAYDPGSRVQRVVQSIAQPRHREHPRDHYPAVEYSLVQLKQLQQEIDDAVADVKRAQKGDMLVTGDHCQFCPVRAYCPEVKKQAEERLKAVFSSIDEQKQKGLGSTIADETNWLKAFGGEVMSLATVDTLAWWMTNASLITGVIERVKSEALLRAMVDPLIIPGFKPVKGREGNREWTSEKEVREYLLKHGLPPEQWTKTELLSPKQLELKNKNWPALKGLFTEYVSRAEGKPTLVRVDDSRPIYDRNLAAKLVFERFAQALNDDPEIDNIEELL